jgi:hypothetical protein
MKRKGEILTWDLHDICTTKKDLADMGFDGYLPRNNNQEVLTKALNEYRKNQGEAGERVISRRFVVDGKDKFSIFNEIISEQDLSLDKEITIDFDKASGTMTTTNSSHPTFTEMVALFRKNSGTINTDQLRNMIKRAVLGEAHGVSIRRNGGAYFVDDRFKENLSNVERIFRNFPSQATLHRIVVYDDASSMEAIESSVKDDLGNDIEGLIADIKEEFEKGTITGRKLEARKEMAEAILTKMKAHEVNLRDSYLTVHRKLSGVQKALEDITGKVESGIKESADFMNLLARA